jgi:hypothetical protein
MFLPTAASAQANFGAPTWEHPLPLMWGQRDEGVYFAAEGLAWRVNNVLEGQVIAQRGFVDVDGSIRSVGGGQISVFNQNNELLTTLFRNRGIPGAFYGNGDVALTADDAGESTYRPGMRLTLGYRLRNGISFEAVYWSLATTRTTAGAGVLPPLLRGVGLSQASSFLTAPFFNFSPQWAGPFRDVVSNIYLLPFPNGNPNATTVTVGPTGSGVQVVIDDPNTLQDLALLRGQPVPAWGISNGAEDMQIYLKQKFSSGELNARVPVYQGEDTRTYAKGGFRYINMWERFGLRVADQDVDANIAPENVFTYKTTLQNRFYGAQGGFGSEAYLFNGFAVSGEVLCGVAGQTSKATINIDRQDGFIALKRTDSKINVTPFFSGGVYLWWYPIEGIQFRAGYEYMGVVGARRATQPIDFNFSRLEPNIKNTYLSFDGFTLGVAFIF